MRRSASGLIVTLALTLLLAPLASDRQAAAKVPLIGFLSVTDPAAAAAVLEPFRQGLHELGYVEGQTLVLAARWAAGTLDRLPALATELVHLPVDVLVAVGAPAAQAAQHATRTIPIVALIGDPVEMGLVASLAQPGGNLTGVSGQTAEVSGKLLELLKEAVPQASRVAVLWNAANPNKVLEWQETQRAAHALRVTLQSVEVRTPDDFERAFAALTGGRPDALITLMEGLTLAHRRQIVDFTTQHRLQTPPTPALRLCIIKPTGFSGLFRECNPCFSGHYSFFPLKKANLLNDALVERMSWRGLCWNVGRSCEK